MLQTFKSGDRDVGIDVHASDEPRAGRRKPAILLLHGAGGNVGFWLDRLAPHVTSAGISVFAPHYFDRTQTVRADLATITDGVHVPLWLETLGAALEFVRMRDDVDSTRIALVGISLGAFLATSYAAIESASPKAKADAAIRCIVELSGGLPQPYASQATSLMPPTLILHGAADTVVPASSARELDALLTQLGVEHETRILPGEGHWFSGAGQMELLLAISDFFTRYLR